MTKKSQIWTNIKNGFTSLKKNVDESIGSIEKIVIAADFETHVGANEPLKSEPIQQPIVDLNLLRDKIHQNAVDKGFYDCPKCNGEGKTVAIRSGCMECQGTGKTKDKNFGEQLMLITSELGEALDADREGKIFKERLNIGVSIKEQVEEASDGSIFEHYVKDTVEDELADALIRILATCGYKDIDINWHVQQKMLYNDTREAKHGKRY